MRASANMIKILQILGTKLRWSSQFPMLTKSFNRVPKESWRVSAKSSIAVTRALTFLFDTRSIILSPLKILWQISFLTAGYFLASEAGQIFTVTHIFRPGHNCGKFQCINVKIHDMFLFRIYFFLASFATKPKYTSKAGGAIFVRIFQFQVDALNPKQQHQYNIV